MTNYLLAGGGTGGHVNPLLALAEQIRSVEPTAKVFALGTKEGLESRLVPERGFELLTIARLPFPRRLNPAALQFPARFFGAVRAVEQMLREHKVDVVVGFGGYAAAPAYWAAKRLSVPFVVHEANALPGLANRVGARFAAAVGVSFVNAKLPKATLVGMPIRSEIAKLSLGIDREAARAHFGLTDSTTLLVTGGSLGARSINETIEASRAVFRAAGIQVLHIVGDRAGLPEVREPEYVRLTYCDRMDLAIAAADFAVARAGASTVSEFSAVGLPAVYVPYPVGNGEQKHNLVAAEAVGGAIEVADKDFTPEFVSNQLVPLISDTRRLAGMALAVKSIGIADGARRLYNLIQGVLKR